MKKMLITGASGFVGGRAAAYYRQRYQVVAPGHGELDITDSDQVHSFLKEFRPDVILHCAAISDVGRCQREPEQSRRINLDSCVSICRSAAEFGSKCVLCSSDQVYMGSPVMEPHLETEALVPGNIYGRDKLLAEQRCLEVNPGSVFLRLSWMYDDETLRPGEHGDFLRTFIRQLESGGEFVYSEKDFRGLTDVTEVVANMEKAAALPGGAYNFGAPNNCSTYRMMTDIFRELGLDPGRIRRPEGDTAGSPRNLCMNPRKTAGFGIHFSSTREGLVRKIKKIMSEHGME